MSAFSSSMAWEYEGRQFEVQYTITPGQPGSRWGEYGPMPSEPDEVNVTEFVLDEADVPAEQVAVIVARMNTLFESDEAFRAELESACLDHAQAKEESRAEDRLD